MKKHSIAWLIAGLPLFILLFTSTIVLANTNKISGNAKISSSLREKIVQDLLKHFHASDSDKLTEEDIAALIDVLRTFAPSEGVSWQIKHANEAKLGPDNYLNYEKFNFEYLTPEDLLHLFNLMQALSNAKDHALAPLVFDIKDRMIRLSYEDEAIRQLFLKKLDKSTENNKHLKEILHTLKQDHLEFYPLIDVKAGHFTSLDYAHFSFGKQPAKRAPNAKHMVIFQASYEAPNMKIGGLGEFLTDFSDELEKERTVDMRFISQYCDFLKRTHPQATFCGFVDHEVYGKSMRSSIYSITINKDQKQYLIKPDPKMARIFDLGKPEHIYKSFKHSEYDPKMAYFNSALATAVATYRGTNGKESVDVLHLHSWHMALAAALLHTKLNPLRESQGIAKVRLLNTIHMHGPMQGVLDANIFRTVGLPLPEGRFRKPSCLYTYTENDTRGYGHEPIDHHCDQGSSENELEFIDLLGEITKYVDIINTVSPSLAEDMQQEATAYGVHSIFAQLAHEGRFLGILNGINTAKFDPRSSSVLGKFAVNDKLSNLYDKKQAVKKTLYEAGILKDKNKPLFIFIGRFSSEKGIDYLPFIAEKIAAKGGQMIVMGSTVNAIPDSIQQLNRIQQYLPLTVFMRSEDQKAILEGTQAQLGMLVRFAADYTVIPSKIESCGLIALEALCMGSFLATAYTQGLKDICYPFNLDHPVQGSGNCIPYKYSSIGDDETHQNIITMIDRCFILEKYLKPSEKLDLQKRIILKSKQHDWGYQPNGAAQQYLALYHSLINTQ